MKELAEVISSLVSAMRTQNELNKEMYKLVKSLEERIQKLEDKV